MKTIYVLRRNAGFTLLELLIAIAIFAILTGIAYSGFGSLTHTKMVVEEESDDLAELQRAIMVLERDFIQTSPRSVRIGNNERTPAMFSQPGAEFIVEFSRNGWRNPVDLPRSNLQRVAYQIKENILYRFHWQNIDRVRYEEPVSRKILSGVDKFELQFLDQDDQWISKWPPGFGLDTGNEISENLPQAVSLNFYLEKWGNIKKILIITGSGAERNKLLPAINDENAKL